MAPISSIPSSLVSTLQGTAPATGAAPVETTTRAPTTFGESLATQSGAVAMGLGAPRNHGDIEALFAEIATRFGVEVAKANNFSEAAEDAKRSTSLRAAAGNLSFFAGLDFTISEAQANIEKQNLIIAQKTAEINAKNAELDSLTSQYDAYRSEWNDNAATQLENAGTIIELGLELAGVEVAKGIACGVDSSSSDCKSLTADAKSLNRQIDALESENATLFDRNLFLDGEMLKLSGQIIQVGFEIGILELERGWAELSKAFSEGELAVAQELLDFFAMVMIPFTVDMALRTIGDSGRASFEMGDDLAGLDSSIASTANNIADQAARMGEIANARKALEQMPTDDPGTLAAMKEFLAGGSKLGDGTSENPVATEAILGLLSSLRQMLGNSPIGAEGDRGPSGVGSPNGPGSRPTNSIDLIRQAVGETLPSGEGDPDRVASEAAGLAAGLAMLRAILGQVASGETSMGTQVPGPSGRLTLAL